jgi:hypothetical protein
MAVSLTRSSRSTVFLIKRLQQTEKETAGEDESQLSSLSSVGQRAPVTLHVRAPF